MSDNNYPNSGSLFKNADKDADHPNWADYNGKCVVDGVEYFINAWIKEGKSGQKFMSLSFKPKNPVLVKSESVTGRDDVEANDFF